MELDWAVNEFQFTEWHSICEEKLPVNCKILAFNGITNNGIMNASLAPMFLGFEGKKPREAITWTHKGFGRNAWTRLRRKWSIGQGSRTIKANRSYQQLFKNAFGGKDAIHYKKTWERQLPPTNAPWLPIIRGLTNIWEENQTILSGNEIDGMNLFLKAGCAKCHNGPMLSDFKNAYIGGARIMRN